MSGRTWQGELCNKRKNGELYWESVSITPVSNPQGVTTHCVALIQEITAQRQAAEKLRQAMEAAEASNRAKSVFLANMSHEIRTPMNAILGFTQLLLRDPDLTPSQRRHLEVVSKSGENLLALINDILEMSKIEAGRTTLVQETFDLHALLDDLEQLFRLRADAKGLRWELHCAGNVPCHLVGDEGKLRQVFINLVGNAIKFTEHGGVQLRVRVGEKSSNPLRLQVEIEDTGVGIAADDVTKLFRPFEQAVGGRGHQTGTGLGLAISREFVRLMDGDLTVRSQLGRGSVFRFDGRFQLGRAESLPKKLPVPRVLGLQPGQPARRVLIVDDDENNRRLLSGMLARFGYDLREARDGVEALAQWQAGRPDLILMDTRLPRLDGNVAIRRIRASAEGAKVKIITISASAFIEDQEKALAAGADAFLDKPVRERDLFDKLHALLDVRYIYEETTVAAASVFGVGKFSDAIRQGLARVSEEVLAPLRTALILADYDRAMELIDQVAQRDVRLAQHLRVLAEQFDAKRLLQLLRPVQEEII